MGNEIKIIIGGDATPLKAATKEASEALGTFTGLTNQTSSSLRKVATESANTAENLKKVSKAAEDIIPEGSILEARESVKRLKNEIAGLTGSQLKSDAGKFLVSELKLAEAELKALETEAGLTRQKVEKIIPPKLPLGAIEEAKAKIKALQSQIQSLNASQIKGGEGKAIAANISGAEKELKKLVIQAGITDEAIGGKGLTKGFGLLRTAANLIPGIGISGIIGAIGVAAIEVAEDLSRLNNAAKLAGQDISKAFAEAEGKVAGERATLQSLIAIARNENLSKEARTEAIKKLNEEYDKYLPKLSLENINTAAVTAEVDKLSAALLRQAKIKGIQDLISKETAKQAEAFTKTLGDNANTVDNIVAVLKSFKAGGNFALEQQIEGAKRLGTNYKESEDKIKAFNKTLNELLTTDAEAGTLFTGKEKQAKKEEDFLKKRLEALEKIKAATKDATSLVGIQESIFELQVKIAIRDQGKNQLSKEEVDKQVLGFKSDLQKAFDNQAIELEAITKVKFSDVVRTDISFKEVESKIQKAVGFNKDIKLPTQFQIDLQFNGQAFAENAERVRQQVKGVSKALFDGIVSGVEEGVSILGEAIGGIFSGEGVTNGLAKAAQGLLGIVGGILQAVGKEIIITSKLVAALKKAIKGLFGPGGEGAALVVGAALIATGAILKNIKFDVPKLAQGGIATGPTLGIFGEKGKEAIIPLDKLPEIVGKLSMNSQANVMLAPTFRISLTDLELGLERVRAQRRRLG